MSLILIDLETTGFSQHKDAIIEVGLIRVTGHKIVDNFHSYINPHRLLRPVIKDLTDITDVTLRDAPDFKDIKDALYEFCGNDLIVAYNSSFDQRFLEVNDPRFKSKTFFDYLKLMRSEFPELDNHKMRNVAKFFGVSFEEKHSAEKDVKIMFEIMRKSGSWPSWTEYEA